MNEKQLRETAIHEVEHSLPGDAPPEARIVHCEAATDWYPDMLRSLSEHKLHVLGRKPDIIVFFDKEGKQIGWRDDGRKGAEQPQEIDPESMRLIVMHELGLPEKCRIGEVRSRELRPLGWTHEAVIFLDPVPHPDQVVRVWVDPKRLHVIQCLFGPVRPTRSAP